MFGFRKMLMWRYMFKKENSKICSTCRQDLPLEMFGKHRSEKDGLYSCCRKCKAAGDKRYCENNKEKCKEKSHAYYKKHEEYIKQRTVAYQKSNPARTKKYSKTRAFLTLGFLVLFRGMNNPQKAISIFWWISHRVRKTLTTL